MAKDAEPDSAGPEGETLNSTLAALTLTLPEVSLPKADCETED